MRLYIKLSRNSKIIPFNYQHLLTGTIHKWLGEENEEHGNRSLYSFSWLQKTIKTHHGFNLTADAYFFISAHDAEFIKRITRGILLDPNTFCGSKVNEIQLKQTPVFSSEEVFVLNSPILLRKREQERVKHVTYLDEDFNQLLTESLKGKLRIARLADEGVSVALDKSYPHPQTKLVDYKGIKNRTTLAPVMVSGSPEQVAFAWQVGLGNSTGIGFGAIK
ncbi:CRISPR-associated endoribonuclease Cas6 [Chitinophaga sp. sic0106]|uniref:CRISPR-associated endoribonuclease Cas6 n=1 Tax=Chitinophaga sp. sic0106 TaxID=2854785 RepID=UPI001C47DFA0|nr:CRISPR-associated endoribonuclease Cas6 [Chitinophaga sp. sic0106]MBV7531078.1 CRISPR-associated endoribonuclease Cas6 [Chitinophaga sp. sic0106]